MTRVQKFEIPAFEGPTGRLEQLRDALREQGYGHVECPLSVLRRLPVDAAARRAIEGTLVYSGSGWKMVGVTPPLPELALAVDLGSTNIAAALVEPSTKRILAKGQTSNPQQAFADDILDRVLHSDRQMEALHPPVIRALNELAAQLCQQGGHRTEEIVLVLLAGNTAMAHLFLGVEACGLPTVPNTPAFHDPGPIAARNLGLDLHPEALVGLVPNVGAFAGGDLMADLIHSGLALSDDVCLLVDVGTNVEIAVGNREWILVAAGAAGPALEGGVVAAGGRAEPGAVEGVRLDAATGELRLSTVGDGAPHRICGSGLIDLMAELFRAGHLDRRGRLVPGWDRIRNGPEGPCVVVADAASTARGEDLVVTEKDFDNLMRSKAGMYSLVLTLIGHLGIRVGEIARWYVCGAFGNHIDPANAVTLGMLPQVPSEHFVQLGNASLQGTVDLILDLGKGAALKKLATRVTYIDINTDPLFMQEFPGALFIPHTDPERFAGQ